MAERMVKISFGGREKAVDLHDAEAAVQALGSLRDENAAVARNEGAQWPERKPAWKADGNLSSWGWSDGGGWGSGDGGGSSWSDGGGCGDGGGSCGGDGGGGH